MLSKAGIVLEWIGKQFGGSILELLLFPKHLIYVCRIKSDVITLDIQIPLPVGNHASLLSSKGLADVLARPEFL